MVEQDNQNDDVKKEDDESTLRESSVRHHSRGVSSEVGAEIETKGQTVDNQESVGVAAAVKEGAAKIVTAINQKSDEIRTSIENQTAVLAGKLEEIRVLQAQLLQAKDPIAISEKIDELQKELLPEIKAWRKALDGMVSATSAEMDLIIRTAKQQDQLARVFDSYIRQLEDVQNIPENLRNPTPERVLNMSREERNRLSEEEYNDLYKNEDYQRGVEEWVEDRLREMEGYELSFEEQGESYRYIALYVNSFSLRPETKIMGEKLRDKLETRRIAHRMARVWDLAGPESILKEASIISFTTFGKMFKEGGFEAQTELRNFERMGRILGERRNKLLDMRRDRERNGVSYRNRSQEERDIEKEVAAKSLYILDYYKHGGHIDDKGIEDAYTGTDEKYNGEMGGTSNDNRQGFFYKLGTRGNDYDSNKRAGLLDEVLKGGGVSGDEAKRLRNNVWAKKYAGKLWSISLRASHHDVLINGSGDFFGARIMNFTDRLRSNALLQTSKEIWDPTTGSYKDKPLTLGYSDLITEMTKDIGKNDVDDVREAKLRRVGILSSNGVRDMKGDGLRTLENFEWCSNENGKSVLWDEALSDPNVRPKEGMMTQRMTYFVEADSTRKKLWGANSFFHKPTIEGLLSLEDVFGHMGTGDYQTYKIPGDGEVEVSGIGKKWLELLDRSLEWQKSEAAEDWLGNPLTGYAEKATQREWINTSAKNGMIQSDAKSKLLMKYFNTTSGFRLNRISEISIYWNDFKKNLPTMSVHGFLGFLKRLFGYVFTDELK